MTMTNASSSIRGRRAKFTPQAIEKIKEWVAEGISRDDIASRLGATVGSLQVTCSRLGISLRRIISANGPGRHTAYVRRGITPTPSAADIAHTREQKEVAPMASFATVIRYKGEEEATDIPLSSDAIEALALEAMSRDLGIAELIGQVLVATINKDMMDKILR